MVPTDLPTTPSAGDPADSTSNSRRRRPGPADSPSDSDAGLAHDSRRSQLCDGVPGATARVRAPPSRGDPTTRPGRVAPDSIGPRLALSSPEEPSSTSGQRRRRWTPANAGTEPEETPARRTAPPTASARRRRGSSPPAEQPAPTACWSDDRVPGPAPRAPPPPRPPRRASAPRSRAS